VLNVVGEYTFSHMADMHIMFGRAYGDEVEVRRLHQDASPGCRIRDRETFSSLDRRPRE
jgi:hypothetical protein